MEETPRLRRLPKDRYRGFEMIGKGGMGLVFLALDTELNRRVAFKIVRPDPGAASGTPLPSTPLLASPPDGARTESARSFGELRMRLLQEAWVTGAMEHPGIVPVYELGETEAGIPYYTMRYVRGERTLAGAMRDAKDLDARLALVEPFLKVCDTVRYAHARGVVHRDLKPENIALGEYGEVLVLDWGLAKAHAEENIAESMWRARVADLREAGQLHTHGGALGTPGYMSPEAALGKSEEVDARSDVYSLGAMLYQILTGRLPFDFKTFLDYVEMVLQTSPPAPYLLDPAVPQELSDACIRALSKERSERFQSVDELAARIRRWQMEGPITRQAEAMFRHAETEVEAARGLAGTTALLHLDRATADCTRLLHLRPDDTRGTALLGDIRALRERAIRERMRAGRLRTLRTAGVVGLALVAVGAVVVTSSFSMRRTESEARVNDALALADTRAHDAALASGREAEARRTLAGAFRSVAATHRRSGWNAAARLLAARSMEVAPGTGAWESLAAAEAAWTPALSWYAKTSTPGVVALAPRAPLLFHGGKDRLVRVFDLENGTLVRTLSGHEAPINAIAVSSDGTRVYSGDRDGRVKAWDAASGQHLLDIPKEFGDPPRGTAVTALAVSDDGATLVGGYTDGVVRRLSAKDGFVIGLHVGHAAPIVALTLDSPGMRIVSADAEGGVFDWGVAVPFVESGSVNVRMPGVRHLVRADDDFFACSADGRVRCWEQESNREFIHAEVPGGPFAAIRLLADRKSVVAADARGVLHFFDVEANALRAKVERFSSAVTDIALSSDERVLAVADSEGVRVWDLAMRRVGGGAPAAGAIAVSADGKCGYRSKPGGGIEGARPLAGHAATVTALAEGGGVVYSSSLDGTIRAWDPASGEERASLRCGTEPATALGASADGARVAAGSLAGELYVWEWNTNRRLAFAGERSEPISAVSIGAERLFAADLSGAVRAWDLRTRLPDGAVLPRLARPATALCTDGARLFVAMEDGRLGAWDGRRLAVYTLPAGPLVLRLDVAPGGVRWVDAAGSSGEWDGKEGVSSAPERPSAEGSGRPWILTTPRARLIDFEIESGLMLDGFEVLPIPPDRPHPADEPLSR